MRRHATTRIVLPLELEPVECLAPNDAEDDVYWDFDDPEVTRALRAAKSGRGLPIALLIASLMAFVGGLWLLG